LVAELPSQTAQAVMYYFFSLKQYRNPIAKLPLNIERGNKFRDYLTGELTGVLATKPSFVTELSALDGDDQYQQPLQELRRACAIDWYLPNPADSVLRRFINDGSGEADSMLDEFFTYIDEYYGRDRRLAQIRDMGRLSLAAKGVDLSGDPSIKSELLASRPQWSQLETVDIEAAFRLFRKEKTQGVEKEITAFVGPEIEAKRSIRYPRGERDYETAKANLELYFRARGGRAAKNRRRAEVNNRMAAYAIPRLDEIVTEAPPSISNKEANGGIGEVSLFRVKRGLRGIYTSSPAEFDDFVDDLKGKPPQLIANVGLIIEEVIRDPFGRGTEPMRGQRKTVRFGESGKIYRARKFSPPSKPGFSLNDAEAERYRVAYVVLDAQAREIGILDVLDHDTFDRKYPYSTNKRINSR